MATFGDRLKELRTKGRLTQGELAEETGIDQSLLSKYETGKRRPTTGHLEKLARYFHTSIDYLLGRAEEPTPPRKPGPLPDAETYVPGPIVLLPVYDEAAAGAPCFVDERPIDRRAVEASRVQHDLANYILVRVAGDSMIQKGIMPGGLVLVHRQDTVDDGQTAIIRLRDDGVTIKRVRWLDGGRVMLIPENPMLDEEIYHESEITICGRVVQAITDIE